MPTNRPVIHYTKTDEAPALATYSLLPIVKTFAARAEIDVVLSDISLAGRILSAFPEHLEENQRFDDALYFLGDLTKQAGANIIKLPNISASMPQLKSAIKELQEHGYKVPDYPEKPSGEAEKSIKERYDAIKGSAVNPVLREGNSDRRAPRSVKEFARKHPHSMGAWSKDSRTHVASMEKGDFYGSEKSFIAEKNGNIRVSFLATDGSVKVLKDNLTLREGEVIDASVMSMHELISFFEKQIADAKEKKVLFSVHLKATMMKVSDPIIFGHLVKVFYKEIFDKYSATFSQLGIDARNGLAEVYQKIQALDQPVRSAIESDIKAIYELRPALAMVNSDKGITNLHVPSDVIIDASMPAAIRTSGQMWGPDGKPQDMKAVIPDRCYSGVYKEVIEFCKINGAFDPRTMGSVSNVGLMAQKAEEYGSHDKTFEISGTGKVQVIAEDGTILIEHKVEKGDIWRMCSTQDASVKDWVKLAVARARDTGLPTIFWLDNKRAHDANIIQKVNQYLRDYDTQGLDIRILSPEEATRFTLKAIQEGKDVISVTGNVLRDYLTDLFPILELGTSAKMLSIVPLMNGGGLFETGAGGSAPKHVQQFLQEGHLRWDSLGEFLALAVSFEHLGKTTGNKKALVLSETLDKATANLLNADKSPSRKVHEIDNRGSHFYLALYWANELAAQNLDLQLKSAFAALAQKLAADEAIIIEEFNAAQGKSVDIGGYYQPDETLANQHMRPSETFNRILNSMK